MATLIPVTGETKEMEAPYTLTQLKRILGIPQREDVKFVDDNQGCRWWYWREGHDHRNKNTRASEWLSMRGTMGKRFLGPVLFESRQEVVDAPE